jgi:hypothetical protein
MNILVVIDDPSVEVPRLMRLPIVNFGSTLHRLILHLALYFYCLTV